MKKIVFAISMVFVLGLIISACGTNSSSNNKSQAELVDEQLQGTWKSIDSPTVTSYWTFSEGNYVIELYVNGEKRDKPTLGTYTIGKDAIYTKTDNNTQGSIPYTFENGVLTLNGQNGGSITKE